MRRTALALLIGLLLVSLLTAQPTAPATQPDADGETTTVKRGDLSATIDLEGYFEPAEAFEVRVRPKAYQGELVVESAVPQGTLLTKGQNLLTVESTEVKRQLATAENELATAQANLAKAQADVQLGEAADALAMKVQQQELSNAEAGLKWWEEVDGAHVVKAAELAVKTAKDNVEDQGDELEQLRKMYKSEELTSATADIVVKRALRTLERAKVTQGMQEARETKVKGFDYTVARTKLLFAIEQQKQALAELTAKQQQQAVLRKTALASAQVNLEKAQQKSDDLKSDLAQFSAEAPFDGMVYAGEFVQGRWPGANSKTLRKDEKVQPGTVVLTLVPTGKLRLVLDVPESKLALVKPEMKVRVIPVSAPDAAFTSTLGAPAPVATMRDNQTVYSTPVAMEKTDPRLAAGQRAAARIDVEVVDALLVPSSAVAKGRVKVKAADGKSEWRDVISGHTDGDVVEIRDGLKEGDQVFTKASSK